MTKFEKEVQAMSNKDLFEHLLYIVQRNCLECANKGYTSSLMAKKKDVLTHEAFTRFAPDSQR